MYCWSLATLGSPFSVWQTELIDAKEAAGMMRDFGVHHHVAEFASGRAAGVLSSFDLLKVIEEA